MRTSVRVAGLLAGLLGMSATLATVPGSAALAADGPTVFVVSSPLDGVDVAADGVCATPAGTCTLRAALTEANRATTPARIEFNLPGNGYTPVTIRVGSRLPRLENPLGITVDGYTQRGSWENALPYGSSARILVQVRGRGVASGDGFVLSGPGNTLRGLALFDFRVAVSVVGLAATNNSVVGNHICTDATGRWASPESNVSAAGVLVDSGASYNTVGVVAAYGGATPLRWADRNVISGCAGTGVVIRNRPTQYNQVRNNVIGLVPDGSAANPNRGNGIDIGANSDANLVGGVLAYERNVVSGNAGAGITLQNGTRGRRNKILGNAVGTNIYGNLVSEHTGNGGVGIDLAGVVDCGLCSVNSGYAEVAYNTVVGNGSAGVVVDQGQQRNLVHHNSIGAFTDGRRAGNDGAGILVASGAVFNKFEHNVVANNGRGIQLAQPMAIGAAGIPIALPVMRNVVGRNSVYDNGGALEIDLAPLEQANIGGVADLLVQQGVQAPAITAIAADGSSVTLQTCSLCLVELFDTGLPAAAYSQPGMAGQARAYLGDATADVEGRAVVNLSASRLPMGRAITATATDALQNTSELARVVPFMPATVPQVHQPAPLRDVNAGAYPLSGNASPGDRVTVSMTDGASTVTATAVVAADRSWSTVLDVSGLLDGYLMLRGVSTNSAAQTSVPLSLVVEKRTMPAPAVLTTTGPVTSLNRGAVPFAGTANPGAQVWLELTDGVTTRPAVTVAQSDGRWSLVVSASGLVGDSLRVTATARNIVGTGPQTVATVAVTD